MAKVCSPPVSFNGRVNKPSYQSNRAEYCTRWGMPSLADGGPYICAAREGIMNTARPRQIQRIMVMIRRSGASFRMDYSVGLDMGQDASISLSLRLARPPPRLDRQVNFSIQYTIARSSPPRVNRDGQSAFCAKRR